MKVLLNIIIAVSAVTLASAGQAFPELPFCPAGGPPGWLNYFSDKHDRNKWRRHSRYTQAWQDTRHYPGYTMPAYRPVYRQYDYPASAYTHTPRY